MSITPSHDSSVSVLSSWSFVPGQQLVFPRQLAKRLLHSSIHFLLPLVSGRNYLGIVWISRTWCTYHTDSQSFVLKIFSSWVMFHHEVVFSCCRPNWSCPWPSKKLMLWRLWWRTNRRSCLAPQVWCRCWNRCSLLQSLLQWTQRTRWGPSFWQHHPGSNCLVGWDKCVIGHLEHGSLNVSMDKVQMSCTCSAHLIHTGNSRAAWHGRHRRRD